MTRQTHRQPEGAGLPKYAKPAQLVGGPRDGERIGYVDVEQTACTIVICEEGDEYVVDLRAPRMPREDLADVLSAILADIKGAPRTPTQPGRRC